MMCLKKETAYFNNFLAFLSLSSPFYFFISIVILSLFFIPNFSFGQLGGSRSIASMRQKMQGFIINAEDSEHDTEAETLDLTGKVHLIYKDQHLSCDKARINFRARSLQAIGHVTFTTTQATISAEQIYLDYENSTGMITKGYVQAGNVVFEGDMILKTGDLEYYTENSKYTSCTNCPETWSFTGNRIKAELGGYTYIKNAIMRVGGVPILWLPYLVVPLRSERQTGLLSPEFSNSREGGLSISETLFWAISKSQDASLTLQNYELRGLKGLLDYRYMLSPESSGEFNGALISDKVYASDNRLNTFRTPNNKGYRIKRWFIKYEHYYELPENYIHRTKLNNASDLQYPKDFPLETKNYGDSAMENRMSLTKNSNELHLSLDTSYYMNLLQSDPMSSNSYSVHKVPEIRVIQKDKPLGTSSLLWSYDLNYSYFARSNYAYDDMNHAYTPPSDGSKRDTTRHINTNPNPNCTNTNLWEKDPNCYPKRDGQFNPETDIIRAGQRFDGIVNVVSPFKLNSTLDFLPKISFRETQYFFPIGNESYNARRYIRTELSTRTTVSQIYDSNNSYFVGKIKHEIQPEISATYIPWFYHPYHSFFGARMGDHSEMDEAPFSSQDNISDTDIFSPYSLQFDYNDRIFDRKLITFSITNKLIQKIGGENFTDYRKFLNWKLAQSYDAYQADRDGKQPLSDILSIINVNLDRIELYQRSNYFPYQRVTNSSSRIRFLDEKSDYMEFSHVRTYSITPGQEVDTKTRTEEFSYTLKKVFRHIYFYGKFNFDLNPPPEKEDLEKRLKSYAYGMQIRLPGDCWYVNFVQYQKTGGNSEQKYSFDFSWDGVKMPNLPEKFLSNFGF